MDDETAKKARLQRIGNAVRLAFASKGCLSILYQNRDALLLVAAMSHKPRWGELRALLLRTGHTATEISRLVEVANAVWKTSFPEPETEKHHEQ